VETVDNRRDTAREEETGMANEEARAANAELEKARAAILKMYIDAADRSAFIVRKQKRGWRSIQAKYDQQDSEYYARHYGAMLALGSVLIEVFGDSALELKKRGQEIIERYDSLFKEDE
jgi:hypothetical protein